MLAGPPSPYVTDAPRDRRKDTGEGNEVLPEHGPPATIGLGKTATVFEYAKFDFPFSLPGINMYLPRKKFTHGGFTACAT